jgi:hypothetical protein
MSRLQLPSTTFIQQLSLPFDLFLPYGFLVSYNSPRQSYFELEFTRANLYIVIFKEIPGGYDKVPYSVWILYVFLFLKVCHKARQKIVRIDFIVIGYL